MPNPVNSVFLKPDIGAGARGTKKIEASEGFHLWEYLLVHTHVIITRH